MKEEFSNGDRGELSATEISGLRSYRVSAPGGSLHFVPRVKRYGQEVVWEARAHIKGAMGPVHATKPALEAIGAPDDWGDKVPAFLKSLQADYPSLPALFPQQESKALTEGNGGRE